MFEISGMDFNLKMKTIVGKSDQIKCSNINYSVVTAVRLMKVYTTDTSNY